MNDHEQFTNDLMQAGWDVEDFEVRLCDTRPSVRAYTEKELQKVIRATAVIVDWEGLGMGYVVYPASRAR